MPGRSIEKGWCDPVNAIRDRLFMKAAHNHIPIMSAMELLPVCNLKCKMCYVRMSMDQVKRSGGLKDGTWWLDMARQMRDEGMLYPLLTGGEPFLHPDFRRILEGMLDMGLQVSINSNGTMIDEDTARWLQDHRPVRINITLYGASRESYGKLCGNADAFDKLLKALEYLKKYGIPVKFNTSITPDNVHELDQIIHIAKEYGSPIQVATYMFPPTRRDSTSVGRNHRLTPKEAALARVQADFLQMEPEWFVGQAEQFARFVPLDKLDFSVEQYPELPMTCRAGNSSAWINWKGELTNCGMYGSVVCDLEGRSFRDAWKELHEKTAQLTYRPACTMCPNFRICHICIAMIHNECGGTEGRPEYMCQMNQEASRLYKEYAERYFPEFTGRNLPPPEQPESCEV